jgi:hypothetical protein
MPSPVYPGYPIDQTVCNGRLTLQSGIPIPTTDQTGKSVIYYTPYNGNRIALYNTSSSSWLTYVFSEISLTLSSLTSATNYDVFVYNNAGTPALELSAAWASNTSPTDSIVLQAGVSVKSSDHSRRWVGTIRTTGTTTTEDSGGGASSQVGGKRFVWNAYNRVRRPLNVIDGTGTWSYTTATWRQANGASGNKVEYVCGDASIMLEAEVVSTVAIQSASNNAYCGIGIDSTSANSGLCALTYFGGAQINVPLTARYTGIPGLGYHAINWMEKGTSAAVCVFFGNNGGDGTQSGLTAKIEA